MLTGLRELHNAGSPELAALGLYALVVSGVWTALSRRAVSLLALAGASVLWLLVNSPLEGRVLLELDPTHGVTQGDLFTAAVVVPALLVRGARYLLPTR
ncbi:hypothetical protein ACIB24_21070 [Spongisporangium articulatum]|uniref:Lycopene cyclase domain-containing protein n=1 Tax=Spongisporangium articulatum TaxID=3362603 RepID=A0ABW8AVC3_9ACTN